MERGQLLDITPDDREVLCNVVFEDLYDEGIADDPSARRAWMVEMADGILRSAGLTPDEDTLFEEYDLRGEDIFWQYVGGMVQDAGFDIYDSDSLFEVYETSR